MVCGPSKYTQYKVLCVHCTRLSQVSVDESTLGKTTYNKGIIDPVYHVYRCYLPSDANRPNWPVRLSQVTCVRSRVCVVKLSFLWFQK